LDVGRDDVRRRQSIPEINSLAAGPAILAGDLNSTPDSATLRALATEWSVAGRGKPLLTIPTGTPRRQIDFVLFRPAHRWRVIEVRVLDERVASDHRPIFAVLELK
jgi:endonuclease/exonuclease/phosphatase (EEP) superfamily protein YafD